MDLTALHDLFRFAALLLGVLCLAVILATVRIYFRDHRIGRYVAWMAAFGALAVVSMSLGIYDRLGEARFQWWNTPLQAAAFACLLWAMWSLRRHHKRRT